MTDGRIWLDQVPKGIMAEMGSSRNATSSSTTRATASSRSRPTGACTCRTPSSGTTGRVDARYLHVGRAIRRVDGPPDRPAPPRPEAPARRSARPGVAPCPTAHDGRRTCRRPDAAARTTPPGAADPASQDPWVRFARPAPRAPADLAVGAHHGVVPDDPPDPRRPGAGRPGHDRAARARGIDPSRRSGSTTRCWSSTSTTCVTCSAGTWARP